MQKLGWGGLKGKWKGQELIGRYSCDDFWERRKKKKKKETQNDLHDGQIKKEKSGMQIKES